MRFVKLSIRLTIEPERKGVLKGRQITDNLLNIRTALQAIEHQNTNRNARGKNNGGKRKESSSMT